MYTYWCSDCEPMWESKSKEAATKHEDDHPGHEVEEEYDGYAQEEYERGEWAREQQAQYDEIWNPLEDVHSALNGY